MNKSIKLIVLVFLAAVLLAGFMMVRPFGQLEYSDMDDYYLDHAQQETGSNNIVTSVVYDYRGFDTLGEATVLFGTAVGMLALFRGVPR